MDTTKAVRGLHRTTRGLDNLSRYITIALTAVVVAALSVMTVATCAQVFFRYVLNSSLFWSEEVSLGCLVWLTFAGTAVGVRRGAHIAITAVYRRLSGRLRAFANIVTGTAIAWVGMQLIHQGWFVALVVQDDHSPSLGLSMFWFRLALPAGGIGILVNIAPILIRAVLGLIRPQWSDADAVGSGGGVV